MNFNYNLPNLNGVNTTQQGDSSSGNGQCVNNVTSCQCCDSCGLSVDEIIEEIARGDFSHVKDIESLGYVLTVTEQDDICVVELVNEEGEKHTIYLKTEQINNNAIQDSTTTNDATNSATANDVANSTTTNDTANSATANVAQTKSQVTASELESESWKVLQNEYYWSSTGCKSDKVKELTAKNPEKLKDFTDKANEYRYSLIYAKNGQGAYSVNTITVEELKRKLREYCEELLDKLLNGQSIEQINNNTTQTGKTTANGVTNSTTANCTVETTEKTQNAGSSVNESSNNNRVSSKQTSGLNFGERETVDMPCNRLKLTNQYGFTQDLYTALFEEHLLVEDVEQQIKADYHSFESQDAGVILKSGVKSFTNFPMTKDEFLQTFYGYSAADFPNKVSQCNEFLSRMENEGILKYDDKTKMYDIVTVFDRADFPKSPVSGAAMTKDELLNYYFIKEDELNKLVADGTFKITTDGKYKLNDTALFLDIGMYYALQHNMKYDGANGVGLEHTVNIAQYIEMVGETVHLGWNMDKPVPENAECALFKVKDDAPREVLEYIFKAVFYNSDNSISSLIYERYLNNELTHLTPYGGLMQNSLAFEACKGYDASIHKSNCIDPNINDFGDLETDPKIALFSNWMNFINYPEKFDNNAVQEELKYRAPIECKYNEVMNLFTDKELDELIEKGIMPKPETRTTDEIQQNRITIDLNKAQGYFGFNISSLSELKAAFSKRVELAASEDINNGTLMLTQDDVDILRNFAKETDEKGKKHGVQTNVVGEYETFINNYLIQVDDNRYVFDLDRIKKDYPKAYEELMWSCNCMVPNYIENRTKLLCYYDNKYHLWETDGEFAAMQYLDIIIKAMRNSEPSSNTSPTNVSTDQNTNNNNNNNSENAFWNNIWGGQVPWNQNKTVTKEQALKRYLKQDLNAGYLGPGAATITVRLHELFPVGSSIEDNFYIPAPGQTNDRILIWPEIKTMLLEPQNIDNMLKEYEKRMNDRHNSKTVRQRYEIILDYMKPLAEKIKEAYAKVERDFSGGVYENSTPQAFVEAYEEYLIPVLEWLQEYDRNFCLDQMKKNK